jgi:hypothetical protein
MAWHCGKSGCPTHSSPSHHCKNWTLAAIGGSVGAGGRNNAADVKVVQGALNRIGPPFGPESLATSGSSSATLEAALKTFQRFAVGSAKPDGRVDPGGSTFRALAGTLRRKRIAVSLEAQELYALLDGRCVMRFLCVTGDDDHPTDKGVFPISRKAHPYRSKTYDVQMNYAMFFTKDGKAIHQYHGTLGLVAVRSLRTYVSDWFGSHGCVRLEKESALPLYEWTPLHTPVHVY